MIRIATISGITALALAVTPLASKPAAAADDFAKFLAGAVVLGIVGASIHDRNKSKRHHKVIIPRDYDRDLRPSKRHVKKHRRHNHRHETHRNDRRHDHNRLTRRTGRNHVHTHRDQFHNSHKPRECLRQRWTHNGWVKFYSKRCLAKYGF